MNMLENLKMIKKLAEKYTVKKLVKDCMLN
jgi:hypothetical protein